LISKRKFSKIGTTGLVVTTPLIAESCFSRAEEETINFIYGVLIFSIDFEQGKFINKIINDAFDMQKNLFFNPPIVIEVISPCFQKIFPQDLRGNMSGISIF
jgi:hypothetical protein